MKENLKLGVILFIITAVAGLFLGLANAVTKAPIEKQAIQEKNIAMQEILPAAEGFELMQIKIEEGSIIREVNKGTKGSEVLGYAIKVAPKGFGGIIQLMVGITSEGKLGGIKILNHAETPGLGANATNIEFSGQYKDKEIDENLVVIKNGAKAPNEIQAITGATITSKAITNGVNEAINFFNTNLKGGQ